MKIIIAPDSFKGSITAIDASQAIEEGVRSVLPDAQIVKLPVADGGEGTVDAFAAATSCRKIKNRVTGPLGGKIDAYFAVLDNNTAVIEMAAASGLTLIAGEDRNPLITTTYGTGELVKAALDQQCRKIIIGLGGSATNDGGIGFAQALGISFKDVDGNELGYGGGELGRLAEIDVSNADPRLKSCEIIAACDVRNTLCGDNGAAAVFGPQKGASKQMVKTLDKNLEHYSEVIRKQLGNEVKNVEGMGAAGGLSVALITFCNAKLESGIDLILDTIGFDREVKSADLVITGEGRIDNQSVCGKVPVGVGNRARRYQVPVIAITGEIGSGAEAVYNYGITSLVSIANRPMSLQIAIDNAYGLLKDATERSLRILIAGTNLRR